jgi:hypothetical protein
MCWPITATAISFAASSAKRADASRPATKKASCACDQSNSAAFSNAVLELLAERQFPVGELYLLASENSAGEIKRFEGQTCWFTPDNDIKTEGGDLTAEGFGFFPARRPLFDRLRKQYQERREWSSLQVICDDASTAEMLTQLGVAQYSSRQTCWFTPDNDIKTEGGDLTAEGFGFFPARRPLCQGINYREESVALKPSWVSIGTTACGQGKIRIPRR